MTVAPVLLRMHASIVATCLLIGACAEAPTQSDGLQEPPQSSSQAMQSLDTVSSVSDGVFSREQSRRGEARYLETCEKCHEKDLAGGAISMNLFHPSSEKSFCPNGPNGLSEICTNS